MRLAGSLALLTGIASTSIPEILEWIKIKFRYLFRRNKPQSTCLTVDIIYHTIDEDTKIYVDIIISRKTFQRYVDLHASYLTYGLYKMYDTENII